MGDGKIFKKRILEDQRREAKEMCEWDRVKATSLVIRSDERPGGPRESLVKGR